jgi:MFS family permease
MTTQKKALVAIYVMSFVMLMGGITMTTIAYIMGSYAELGPVTVQQIVSLPAIFGLISSILIGPVAMKVNKKYLYMFVAVCVIIYMAIFALVGANGPFVGLIVATIFGGIAQGTAMTLLSSLIGDFVPPEKSATYVAVGLAVMNAGGVFMNLVGGAIASGNGGANWPYTYYLGILVVPALIFFAIFMPKQPDAPAADAHAGHGEGAGGPPPAAITKFPLTNVAIGILAIFSSVCICGFMFYVSVYIVNEFQLGTSVHAGIANSLFTGAGLVTGFTYAIWAKLFKKMLIIVSFSLVALSLFIMMAITTSLAGVFIAAILLGWGFNMMNPYIMGFIIQTTPPKLIPVGISLLMVGANVGMTVAIYVLNFASSLLGGGLKNVLLVCGVGMAICTVFAGFIYRLPKAPALAGSAEKSA